MEALRPLHSRGQAATQWYACPENANRNHAAALICCSKHDPWACELAVLESGLLTCLQDRQSDLDVGQENLSGHFIAL